MLITLRIESYSNYQDSESLLFDCKNTLTERELIRAYKRSCEKFNLDLIKILEDTSLLEGEVLDQMYLQGFSWPRDAQISDGIPLTAYAVGRIIEFLVNYDSPGSMVYLTPYLWEIGFHGLLENG